MFDLLFMCMHALWRKDGELPEVDSGICDKAKPLFRARYKAEREIEHGGYQRSESYHQQDKEEELEILDYALATVDRDITCITS